MLLCYKDILDTQETFCPKKKNIPTLLFRAPEPLQSVI